MNMLDLEKLIDKYVQYVDRTQSEIRLKRMSFTSDDDTIIYSISLYINEYIHSQDTFEYFGEHEFFRNEDNNLSEIAIDKISHLEPKPNFTLEIYDLLCSIEKSIDSLGQSLGCEISDFT